MGQCKDGKEERERNFFFFFFFFGGGGVSRKNGNKENIREIIELRKNGSKESIREFVRDIVMKLALLYLSTSLILQIVQLTGCSSWVILQDLRNSDNQNVRYKPTESP